MRAAKLSLQNLSSNHGLPAVPSVKWEDLYQVGDTPRQTLARLATDKLVLLPNGFDEEIDDFAMVNAYAMYFPKVIGFGGSSPLQCRWRMKRMSSTHTPDEGATMFRLADGRAANRGTPYYAPQNYGYAIEGTDQPNFTHPQGNETQPHNYSGYMNYYGRNSQFQNMKISGIPGNWNSPPGETFAMNCFHDVDSVFKNVEIDGYNVDGNRVGSSPLGGNNSNNILIEDCYFHDAYVSGLTFSFAGTHTNIGAVTDTVTTRRCRLYNNANTTAALTKGGKRFAGINHENVFGKILHDRVDIRLENSNLFWDAGHMSFVNFLADNNDIHIIEPTWGAAHPKMNGCFVIAIQADYAGEPNKQVSMPEVIKNGITLQPFHVSGNPSSQISANPAQHYVVLH